MSAMPHPGDRACDVLPQLIDELESAGLTDDDLAMHMGSAAWTFETLRAIANEATKVGPGPLAQLRELARSTRAVAAPAAAPALVAAPTPAPAPSPAVKGSVAGFTLITSRDPARLGKRFERGASGGLVKLPGGNLLNGTARRVSTDLQTLANLVATTQPDAALVLGEANAPGQAHTVVTAADATPAARAANPLLIARTQADFGWPTGPGLLLIDTDAPKRKGMPVFTRAAIHDALTAICPAIAQAPRLVYDSSGSWVFDAATGDELVGQRGLHTLLVIEDAGHAPEVAKVLHLRAVVAGSGWLEVGRAGQLLRRSIVDVAAASGPERLVFSFGAEMGEGLEQRRPAPQVFNNDAPPLDTRAIRRLKMTKALQNQADAKFQRLAEDPALLAEQAAVRGAYEAQKVQDQLDALIERRTRAGMPALTADEEAWARDRFSKQLQHTHASMTYSVCNGNSANLQDDQGIYLRDGRHVSVDQILNDPATFDGMQCHDPIEPDYGNHDKRIATIHSRPSGGGRPHVYSHAHGGFKFYLLRSAQSVFAALSAQGAASPPAASPNPTAATGTTSPGTTAPANTAATPASAKQAQAQANPPMTPGNSLNPLAASSDLANAERLAKLANGNVIYVKGYGLLVYLPHQGVWVNDEGEAKKLALRLSRAIDDERLSAEQQLRQMTDAGTIKVLREKIDKLNKAAMNAESARSIKAAFDLLATHVSTRVEFDADPLVLNVRNGTLDLRTLDLRPHNREDHLMQQAAVNFDPNAKAPRWVQFVLEICDGDQALAEYMQTVAGYWLTGLIGAKTLWVQFGTGDNGKNSFNDRIIELMGTYAGVLSPSALSGGKAGVTDETVAAKLLGKRLMVAGEPADGLRLDEAFIKRVTGDEVLPMRKLYKDSFDGRNQVKLAIATNHKPEILGNDPALWERMALVPFNASFRKNDPRRDNQLADKLRAELPGILNWMLEGLQRWRDHGERLVAPPAVSKATDEYKRDEDRLGDFLDDCTDTAPGAEVTFSNLYTAYVTWAKYNGFGVTSSKKFGMRIGGSLKERGAEKLKNGSNTMIVRGVRLRSYVGA